MVLLRKYYYLSKVIERRKSIMLIYDEYFRFTIPTKVKIEKLYRRYTSDFITKEEKKHRSMMCYFAYPLVDELKNLYNNELSLSASIAEILCDSKKINLRVRAFHIENAFMRIVSVWDYIFLALNQYMQTELIASRYNKEEIIKASCYYKIAVKEKEAIRIVNKPMEDEKQDEIRKKLKKELVVITANNLHKCIKEKYAYNENIEKIFDLYKSEPVNEMKKVRNDIVHSGNLGANFSIIPSDMVANQAMSNKNIDFVNIKKIISENMNVVKNAIEILLDFIINDRIPNRKENENKIYYFHKCKCKDCGTINYYTDEIFHMLDKNLGLICSKCNSFNTISLNEKEKISEPVHDNMYIDYLEKMKEVLDV